MTCSSNTTSSIRRHARLILLGLALVAAGAAHGGDDPVIEARRAAAAALTRHDAVSAEVGLRAAIARAHADAALRAWLADALLEQGDRMGARNVLDAGPVSADTRALAARVRGQIALVEGDLGAAARAFDEGLRADPGDADLWVALASLHFTAGQQAEAVAAASRAVVLDPRNPRALALRGLLIREQYGLVAALPWFEAALNVHPDDPALLDAYATTLGDMGQNRAMLTVVRKLSEVDPRNPRPRLMEAVLAARAGRDVLARALLERTGTAFRDMPAAILLSGVLEYRAGNFDLAVAAFDRLVRRQRDNGVARHLLVRALAARHDWGRIVRDFADDAAAGRADPDTQALVGRALVMRGARARGEAMIRAATDQTGVRGAAALAARGDLGVLETHYADNPASADNAVPYIRALIAAHRSDAAQVAADRLRDANMDNADAQMLSGDVRMLRNLPREALADYTNAAAIRFNEAVLARMDAALRACGRGSDADAMTSRYLGQNPESALAMTLLAAGWAANPARASDLQRLRRAMAARGLAVPPSTNPAHSG